MRRKGRRLAALGIVALFFGLPHARATTIYAPNAIVAGQSIADWTEGWYTWAAGQPTPGGAFDVPAGPLAPYQNNNGPVFYGAGYFAVETPPVLRSFTVQAGQPILISLINLGAFQFPEADETSVISSFTASSLTATIDGTPVANPFQYSQTTGFFSAGPIEPNTIGQEFFATPGFPGVPPDCAPTDLCPGLATGYWLMFSLSPGVHTIDTGGTATFVVPPDLTGGAPFPVTFTVATDFTITAVAPEPASALLIMPGLLGVCALRRRRLRREPPSPLGQ